MQLIFQVLGTHHFIKYARTNADIIRGYALLLQIIQGLVTAPILLFNALAIAVFDKLRSQRVLKFVLEQSQGCCTTRSIISG